LVVNRLAFVRVDAVAKHLKIAFVTLVSGSDFGRIRSFQIGGKIDVTHAQARARQPDTQNFSWLKH
jgi:hypothetical protein